MRARDTPHDLTRDVIHDEETGQPTPEPTIEEPSEAPASPPAAPGARLAFRSELTPEGEQLVIPGCERNQSERMRQLDLFG